MGYIRDLHGLHISFVTGFTDGMRFGINNGSLEHEPDRWVMLRDIEQIREVVAMIQEAAQLAEQYWAEELAAREALE